MTMQAFDKFTIVAAYAPLLGFMFSICFIRIKSFSIAASIVGISTSFVSTLLLYALSGGIYRNTIHFADWIHVGDIQASFGLHIDPLVMIMLGVVTFVSFFVHLYSLIYMKHDESQCRFMAYLELFTFMMLILITAPNVVQLFFGWEGMGLASYLLIGFWQERDKASKASTKAFIVNRVGDTGMILGLAFLFHHFGTTDFFALKNLSSQTMYSLNTNFSYLNLYDWICLCLIVGVMGKSAQFGLHVWLPDAMEGPTPVSALIHAATMVTAGIFLIAKLYFLFDLAPFAKQFLIYLGLLTSFFAASVALVQTDIKRIIAYSTCSQLGYMVAACGVGAYRASIFHLMTHAFFKALLFLGAGSVIHAMSDEQDITKMGGIYSYIPRTYLFMWIGTLALIGFPFFAGYYSKDLILKGLFLSGYYWAYMVGVLIVMLTAFYALRLMFLVFHGQQNANDRVMAYVHESPQLILISLFFLSLGAVFSGYFGEKLFASNTILNWTTTLPDDGLFQRHLPFVIHYLPFLSMCLGVFLIYLFYVKKIKITKEIRVLNFIYVFLQNKWFIDEFYEKVIVNPCLKLGKIFFEKGDIKILDGFGPNGLSSLTMKFSVRLHQLQTGYLYHYVLWIIFGLSAILTLVIFMFSSLR